MAHAGVHKTLELSKVNACMKFTRLFMDELDRKVTRILPAVERVPVISADDQLFG